MVFEPRVAFLDFAKTKEGPGVELLYLIKPIPDVSKSVPDNCNLPLKPFISVSTPLPK